MMDSALTKVIEAIAADVLTLARAVVAQNDVGTNPKTGKNTLKNSRLQDGVQVMVRSLGQPAIIEAMFDNYIRFVEQGRRPRSGKQPPTDALRDWALARGIPADNSTLFLIARAIWRDGYQGRPVLATLEEEIDRRFDDTWADMLFEAIAGRFLSDK
jgi:hypothetical protein